MLFNTLRLGKRAVFVLALSVLVLTVGTDIGAVDYDISLDAHDSSGLDTQPDDIGNAPSALAVMVKVVLVFAKVIQAILTLLG